LTSEAIKIVRGLNLYKKKADVIKELMESTGYPEIHGDKVWSSSYFVMDYLAQNPPANGANIMDIGCGWGPLSIYCAKNFAANVTAVDADKNVFPFLTLHAKENNVTITKKICRYEDLKRKTLAKQDILVGGDICFWKELRKPLYKLIKKALEAGVSTIIIADPGRSPFLKLAKKCKKKFGATLQEVSIEDPAHEEGYLLVINKQ